MNKNASVGRELLTAVPMYTLYYDQRDFRTALFKGNENNPLGTKTKRLVFKFLISPVSESLKTTLGVWPGNSKIEYYKVEPLILKIGERIDTNIQVEYFLGDLQVKRKPFRQKLDTLGGLSKRYIVFRPYLLEKGGLYFMAYKVYLSNDTSLKAMLLDDDFFNLNDPSPPADSDSD